MALAYKLAGFGPETEVLVIAHEIPSEKLLQVKKIAGIADKPTIIADWPLSRDQARAVIKLVGADLDVNKYDWALEPYPLSDTVRSE
jgi:hypothetical protein